MQLDAGAAKRQEFSLSWLTSCLSPWRSALLDKASIAGLATPASLCIGFLPQGYCLSEQVAQPARQVALAGWHYSSFLEARCTAPGHLKMYNSCPPRVLCGFKTSAYLRCSDVRTHPTPIQHRHASGQQDLPEQTQHGHEVHLL
ncbi:endothelial PAS domain-containing protein 1-like protein [Lates japonicus]|uniref:Endothelial PAS domain-containing protein 1-like protein n=1 Tax=Lates japonicus TaxID=270547 RepID=A0AAD3RIL3_LATJO|nr:endothelial PAS domain-containing protein 1-like protein [Lates japonicus]